MPLKLRLYFTESERVEQLEITEYDPESDLADITILLTKDYDVHARIIFF